MKVIRPAAGRLCGSVFINKQFEKYLREEYFPKQSDNLKATAGKLGYFDETEFLMRVSVSFDEAKKKFPTDGRYQIHVSSKQNYGGFWGMTLERYVSFLVLPFDIADTVCRALMQKFFDHVVKEIDEHVDIMMSDKAHRSKTKCFILSGGLGHSDYVIDHISEAWTPKDIKVLHPVEQQ
jgi:hypothetical protein